ncbi:hypothetical protein SKA58_07208 [Sphingomonas sp. SKA58]|nr:hypothetical protein SKA58_07208 [Sphingomonas sp. SKA58]
MAREIGALGADEKEGAMKEEMLARLVAQAQGQVADMVTIRALIEEASDLGAGRALERLGLSDRGAETDVRELRELLSAWRDAKKAARGAVIGWIVRIGMALVLPGVAVKVGLVGLVKA